MDDETIPAQPLISEYQGEPIIRTPTVDNPNPDNTWHWLSFGKNKAKAIVKFFASYSFENFLVFIQERRKLVNDRLNAIAFSYIVPNTSRQN